MVTAIQLMISTVAFIVCEVTIFTIEEDSGLV
jgi:hypothetical protein